MLFFMTLTKLIQKGAASLALVIGTSYIPATSQEMIINPSHTQTTLAQYALSGKDIHDHLVKNPQEQRNLERSLDLQLGSLSLLFDNTYSQENPEFEGWEKRDGRVLIYSTDKKRQGRVEQGRLVTTGYKVESFELSNPQAFEELYQRIWKVHQQTRTEEPSTQPVTRPTQQYQSPTQQQETVKPEKDILSSLSDSFGRLSDLEKAGLIAGGLFVGYKVLIDKKDQGYRRSNTRYYSRESHKPPQYSPRE